MSSYLTLILEYVRMSINSKIIILGAGPTGSLLALALAKVGSTVSIYDPKVSSELCSRSRAYALTHSSCRLLKRIGIWSQLESNITPFKNLSLSDQETGSRLMFNHLTIYGSSSPGFDIGWIIDHKFLMQTLHKGINNNNQIISRIGEISTSKNRSDSDLIIAADGARSSTRSSWAIKCFGFKYSQSCITSKVLIRGARIDTAYEVFRKEGPMAVLPMGGDNFQVVWSAPSHLSEYRASLKASQFLDQLATALPDGLEPDVLLEKPTCYPVYFSISKRINKKNKFLIGEAAHTCHPVGGQGLNLCWRDIDILMSLVDKFNKNKINRSMLSTFFTVNRICDILSICLLTDVLVRIFSNSNPFILILRKLFLKLMLRSRVLRKYIYEFMTSGFMPISKRLSE